MRINKLLAAGILFVAMIVLAACSSASTPTQEPAPVVQPSPSTQVEQANEPTVPAMPDPSAYPAPAMPTPNAYPGPFIQYVIQDPYPAPIDGEQIEWSEVKALLDSGQVAEVFQRLSLPVVITMKDSRIFLVESPAKDEIFKLLDQCGGKCDEIRRLSDY